MPSYILKASKDEDLYVEWSTIVDAPTFIGTRAETFTHLLVGNLNRGPVGANEAQELEARLARADASGTSAHDSRNGGWDDAGLIYEQMGTLPRSRLADMAKLFLANGVKADVSALLEPFGDD